MTETKPLQAFLCYAKEDREEVLKIYDFLQTNGIRPWMDEKNILPGQQWKSEILDAIDKSDVFLACVSPNMVNKEGHVQKEIGSALNRATYKPEEVIYIIPVRLFSCEVPQLLSDYHYGDWFTKNGRKKLLGILALAASRLQKKQLNTDFETEESERVETKSTKNKQISDVVLGLTEKINSLQKRNERDQQEIANLALNNNDLQRRIFGYKLENENMSTKNDDLRSQLLTKQKENESTKDENNDLRNQLSAKQRDLHYAKNENDDLRFQLSTKQNEINSVKNENRCLRNELLANQQMTVELQSKNDELQTSALTLQQDLIELKGKNESLQMQIRDYKETINEITDKIKDIELNTPKYHGASFIQIYNELVKGLVSPLLPEKQFTRHLDEYMDRLKKKGYFVGNAPTLLHFFWISSRLLDSGIRIGNDHDDNQAIYMNIKRLVDLGLVQRQKRENQMFYINSETGKRFLVQLTLNGDPKNGYPIADTNYVLD